MSKKAAEHHKHSQEHHTHGARHHGEAAKHHESGHHEKAALRTPLGDTRFTPDITRTKPPNRIWKSTARSSRFRNFVWRPPQLAASFVFGH